jgi:hypothetical protein
VVLIEIVDGFFLITPTQLTITATTTYFLPLILKLKENYFFR